MKRSVKFILLLIFLLIYGVHKVYAYDVPNYDGYVNDFADVLSEETEQQLEDKLTALSKEENGIEIAVVTVDNLEGESVEGVSQQFFDTWKIGKKNIDNGVLLLISKQDRELRIQTGYGAEAFLTDAQAGRIIRNVLVPPLKKDDYDQAVILGVDAIIKKGENIDQSELIDENIQSNIETGTIVGIAAFFYFVGSFLVIYVASFLGRTKSWWLGGVIGLGISLLFGSITASIILSLIGLLLDYILSKNYKKWKLENKSTAWRKTFGGFVSSGSSGHSSFGGGSSGGGGASGSF